MVVAEAFKGVSVFGGNFMFPVRPTAGRKRADVLLYLTDLVNKPVHLTRCTILYSEE